MITQTLVRKLFDYDEVTGVLAWRISPANRVRVGDRAGWATQSYRQVSIEGRSYQEHCVIWLYMTGHWPSYPEENIDHIDRDKSNNIWNNLRIVSHSVNGHNAAIRSHNTSGHKGVALFKESNKWMAYISVNGKRIHLGLFNLLEDAVKARKDAEVKYGLANG